MNTNTSVIPWVSALIFGAAAALAQTAGLKLTVNPTAPPELSWPSETGFDYRLEATTSLAPLVWETLAAELAGTGALLKVTDPAASGLQRYYRTVRVERVGPQISPEAVDPVPGQVYPAGTIIGSPYLGVQFTVPANWKGGARAGTSTLLLASDTEPGLVLGFIALAGDADRVAAALGQSFAISQFGGFQVSRPAQVSGGRVTVEWAGVGFDEQGGSLNGVSARCQAGLHPSGGTVAFVGFFTEVNRAVMERVLNDLSQSTVTVARKTRADLVNAVAGKSFVWVKAANTGNGGTSGSLQRWSQKNAFFCPGTYEITTQSESSYSGNLSGGGFYTGYSSSNSTEAGDWTIVDTEAGPALIMISGSGVAAALISITGNSVIFGDQQFDFQGLHGCAGP